MEENKSLENGLLKQAEETAIEEKKKEDTRRYLAEQVKLMKVALSQIDVYNLRLGPYTNTVLVKINLCREVLDKNGEEIIPNHLAKLQKALNKIEKLISKKARYGKQVDKYLEAKENSLIESIKSNLLGTDLEDFELIRTKLVGFKNDLVAAGEKLDKALCSCKVLKPAPEPPVVVTPEEPAAPATPPEQA